jgi:hypothetical protein
MYYILMCSLRSHAISFIITSWYNPYIRQTMSHHRRWGDISRSTCYIFYQLYLDKNNMYQEVLQHTLSCLGTYFLCKHFYKIKPGRNPLLGFASLTPSSTLFYDMYQEVFQHTLSCLGTYFLCKHFYKIKPGRNPLLGFASLTPSSTLFYDMYQEVLQHTLSCLGIIMILLVESIRTIRGRTFIHTHRTVGVVAG